MADYSGRASVRRHAPEAKSEPNGSKKAVLKTYYNLTKPGIIYANVITGASGYLLASKWHIHVFKLICLLLGMGLLIGGSCVINNYLDRGIDAKMERTQKRALVTGQISAFRALVYAAVLLVIGFVFLAQTNKLTVLIGVLAVIFYVIIYGLAKRYSVYGALVGTLPGGASLIAGYGAVSGNFSFAMVLLLLLMVCWQMAHFYAIGIYRLKDYTEAGVPLWPVKRGVKSTKKQIRFFIMSFIVVSILVCAFGYAGYSYLAVIVLLSGYWLQLAYKPSDAKTDAAWAKKIFLFSLIVQVAMSVMLPVSTRFP